MPHFWNFFQGIPCIHASPSGKSINPRYQPGLSPPMNSLSESRLAGSGFSGFFENQLLELAEVSEALTLGGLSNGFRKLVVLVQAFFVPRETLDIILGLLTLGFGLDQLGKLGQEGSQLFFGPDVVTPLAAGLGEPPNQPSVVLVEPPNHPSEDGGVANDIEHKFNARQIVTT